ncbi:MAG: hypothetical protein IJB85_02045 [Clostridia bacterium]|nr:hypothetical protein [Clostridia bacterium]
MMKKLVALTLAALMLLNPMTAFAVEWSAIVEVLDAQRAYNEGGVVASVDEYDNVVITQGEIENFYHDSRFASYTFADTVVIGGETFHIFVGESETVTVDIQSGAIVSVQEANISAGSDTTVTLNNAGEIKTDAMFANSHIGGTVIVNNEGTITVEDEFGIMGGPNEDDDEVAGEIASITTLNNEGILTAENLWGWSHDNATVSVNNSGTINMEVGEHENESEDEEGPGNVQMMADGSGNLAVNNSGTINGNVDISMGWEDETADAVGTGSITNSGTINGHANSWIHDDANSVIENSGTVNGVTDSFAHDTADTSVINTDTGVVNGGSSIGTENGTASLENAGAITGENVSVSSDGAGNASFVNSGTIDVEWRVNVESQGSGEATFSNTGDINGGERFDLNSWNSGSVTGTNEGTISADWLAFGSADNSETSFTNEGTLNAEHNTDVWVGDYVYDENYAGFNPDDSSTTSFVNNGEINNEGFNAAIHENGSLSIVNGAEGVINSTPNADGEGGGVYINNPGTGVDTSLTMENAGTLNGEYVGIGIQKGGEASFSNSGTINSSVDAWAGTSDETADPASGTVSMSNSGEIAGGMYFNSEEGSTLDVTVSNSGTLGEEIAGDVTGSVTATNDGTVEGIFINGYGDNEVVVENNGTINGRGGVASHDGANATFVNNGEVLDHIYVESINGDTTVENNGTTGNLWTWSDGDASMTATNNGSVEGDFFLDALNGTVIDATNNGYIGQKFGANAYDESSVTLTNTAAGTIGDGLANGVDEEGNELPPDGIWGGAFGNASVNVKNEGAINGEVGGGAYEEGSAVIENTGSATSAWIDSYGNANVSFTTGNVSGTTSVAGDKDVTIVITTGDGVVSADKLADVLASSVDMSQFSGKVDVYTAAENGDLTAYYAIDENGNVVMLEKYVFEDNGPQVMTKERIRHDMEEKRKAQAIGGVYGSPYWLKQLYLGYNSLNLRLFSGDKQLLFKENLSWLVEEQSKLLTLTARTEDTSSLMMRLDGEVIDILERAEISKIAIKDYLGNPFMEYSVEDLKGARALYNLEREDYIVVGAADADVMKIGADGKIVPIEGEEAAAKAAEAAETAEAEAAEEVADEANKAETEETAQEDTAA